MKVITHNDRFHADDVFALAALRIKFGDEISEVIRTRDEKVIDSADIVFDVGGINDGDKNRFDHHQPEGGGVRENGFPYASFGLVWQKWGEEICGSEEAAEIVDRKLVQPIDAGDNGHAFYDYREGVETMEYTMGGFCYVMGPTWKEEDDYDKAYFEAVDVAEIALKREIIRAQHKVEAIPIILKAMEEADDKRLVVLDEYVPWGEIIKKDKDVLFVISPVKDKSKWRVNTVEDTQFVNRKDLPKEWAGLRDEELEKVTRVKGSVFCHRGLFLAVGDSKESALQLAKLALEY
jgi:uncharacterized UPF0160 family protein